MLTYFYKYGIIFLICLQKGGLMEKSIVTAKGQIVIPSKLRHKLGIEKGTRVYLYEQNGEIVVRPVTDDYIRSLAGITKTGGKLLEALLEEKAKEREL